jgi:hypothetical protein
MSGDLFINLNPLKQEEILREIYFDLNVTTIRDNNKMGHNLTFIALAAQIKLNREIATYRDGNPIDYNDPELFLPDKAWWARKGIDTKNYMDGIRPLILTQPERSICRHLFS